MADDAASARPGRSRYPIVGRERESCFQGFAANMGHTPTGPPPKLLQEVEPAAVDPGAVCGRIQENAAPMLVPGRTTARYSRCFEDS